MSRIDNSRNKVMEKYPRAKCKKRKKGLGYDVFDGTRIIAGAYSAVRAWNNAAAKIGKNTS